MPDECEVLCIELDEEVCETRGGEVEPSRRSFILDAALCALPLTLLPASAEAQCCSACETSCQSCQGVCETGCEITCENCEGLCESGCEVACQTSCDSGCQSGEEECPNNTPCNQCGERCVVSCQDGNCEEYMEC